MGLLANRIAPLCVFLNGTMGRYSGGTISGLLCVFLEEVYARDLRMVWVCFDLFKVWL